MFALLAFAFVSGIITILSPCILPVLPIVLAGSVGKGRKRPIGIIVGFIGSFAGFTLALTAIVETLGIPANAMRVVAVVLIVGMGLTMLIPRLRGGFEALISRISFRRPNANRDGGFLSGLPVGMSLGLIWTPCVGPIMASVISLALTRELDGGAVLITVAYTVGTAIPMIAILLGGRTLLTRVPALSRHSAVVQRVFGVVAIVAGLSIGFGLDLRFQSAILTALPNYGSGLTAIENSDAVRVALDKRATSINSAFATTSGTASGATSDAGLMLMSANTVVYDSFNEQPTNGKLGDYGPAPELVAQGEWLNFEALGISGSVDGPVRMADLRGKVVVVDFWTYSCVNCIRTIPYLKTWYEAFKDEEFVIIGVHTPEFEFEKITANVERAMNNLGVEWPVVQDNNYRQWRAYNNRYWPAKYFIDAEGHIRYFHYGEGEYDTSEAVIRALLREAGTKVARRARLSDKAPALESRTPETYLGYGRSSGFISAEKVVADIPSVYTAPNLPVNGEWNLDGTWNIAREYVAPEDSGVLTFGFHAKDVFLVIEPADESGTVRVFLDGAPGADTDDVQNGLIIPNESRLYHLVALDNSGEHTLRLEVQGELRLFAFTFG